MCAGANRMSRAAGRGWPRLVLATLIVAVLSGSTWALGPAGWEPMESGSSAWLWGVWGSGPNDVFAVGDDGTILRHDGSSWSSMSSGSTEALTCVWGSGPNDVFAVGDDGTILRYDGSSWTTMSSPNALVMFGVWGSAPNDVFAVGDDETILHYDGSSWSTAYSGTPDAWLMGIWGTGPNDVYAVGDDETILHYDGSSWSTVYSVPAGELLWDVWGSGPNNIFATGTGGKILHYDGSDWAEMASGVTDWLMAVWGTGPNNVYAVGGVNMFLGPPVILHYDGTAWSRVYTPFAEALMGVWGSRPGDVFAVGPSGTILHYEGVTWSPMESGSAEWLGDVWCVGPNDVFVTGDHGTILHYDGAVWSEMASGTTDALTGVWGSAPNDVFAVGGEFDEANYAYLDGTILHYDGSSWSVASGLPPELPYLYDVWGSGPNDVFAVGEAGTIVHYDGSGWTAMDSGTTEWLTAVYGLGPNMVGVVGGTVVLGYDGSSWMEMYDTFYSAEGQYLRDVWASAPNDIFIAASEGPFSEGDVILHYDGTDWLWHDLGPDMDVFGIWGTAPNDVFALASQWGYDDANATSYLVGSWIFHYKGAGWLPMATKVPLSGPLYAVSGSDPEDVFAVGDEGIILHHPPFYALTVTKTNGGMGEVQLDPVPRTPNSPAYLSGTLVTLTSVPNPGKSFKQWEIYDPNYPDDDNYVVIDTTNPIAIELYEDRQINAVFKCGSATGILLPVAPGILGLLLVLRRRA